MCTHQQYKYTYKKHIIMNITPNTLSIIILMNTT